MPVDTFFEHQTPDSRAKVDIVTSFFQSWMNIIANGSKRSQCPLSYMELFAGQGVYDDGTKSTPIIVLEQILASPHAHRFKVVLNEFDEDRADILEAEVNSLDVSRLAEQPILLREEVDSSNVTEFLKLIPSSDPAVLFADPFGYRGITQELFRQYVSMGWGRDAIFFFNFKRVHAAISQPNFAQNINAMFGGARAAALRQELPRLSSTAKRKQRVLAAMEESLSDAGVRFVQKFEFVEREDSLFFISQKEKGLRTMKDVMSSRSGHDEDGVPLFSYAREERATEEQTGFLFPQLKPATNLELLRADLLQKFAGSTVYFEHLYQRHHPGTTFVSANYRSVLEQMIESGEVTVISTTPRRRGTFGKNVKISFPVKKGGRDVSGIDD